MSEDSKSFEARSVMVDPPQPGLAEFVDASIFLGMNARRDVLRIACKNFFVLRFGARVGMSDDQAGVCDRVIWRLSRSLQDGYYPFMDRLRTDMKLEPVAYEEEAVRRALSDERLDGLAMPQRLTLGMVLCYQATLYTVDAALHGRNAALFPEHRLPLRAPTPGEELRFPDPELEAFYASSLCVQL